jgi:1-aminocyclopropane-1-carboxylate deaminase
MASDLDAVVQLEHVEEGKSMAGLIAMMSSVGIPAGLRVLYAHLGGQLCLSDDAGAL